VKLCLCDTTIPFDDGLVGFTRHRESCRVLKDLLLPDSIWNEFVSACHEPRDKAQHRSILLLAYQHGTLSRITIPIHRFVLAQQDIGVKIAEQYIKDLRERWWLKDNVIDRNRRAKGYLGRISEFLLAGFLEQHGYSVVSMEAWRGKHDIIARDPFGEESSIEVKYIGVGPDIFRQIVASFTGDRAVSSISIKNAANYFLAQVFVAAKQLQNSNGHTHAALVVGETEWSILENPLKEDWIDWDSPCFQIGRAHV